MARACSRAISTRAAGAVLSAKQGERFSLHEAPSSKETDSWYAVTGSTGPPACGGTQRTCEIEIEIEIEIAQRRASARVAESGEGRRKGGARERGREGEGEGEGEGERERERGEYGGVRW